MNFINNLKYLKFKTKKTLPEQKASLEKVESYEIDEPPPFQKSCAEDSQFHKTFQLKVKDLLPPDDVHVDVEHVLVHETSDWP